MSFNSFTHLNVFGTPILLAALPCSALSSHQSFPFFTHTLMSLAFVYSPVIKNDTGALCDVHSSVLTIVFTSTPNKLCTSWASSNTPTHNGNLPPAACRVILLLP